MCLIFTKAERSTPIQDGIILSLLSLLLHMEVKIILLYKQKELFVVSVLLWYGGLLSISLSSCPEVKTLLI